MKKVSLKKKEFYHYQHQHGTTALQYLYRLLYRKNVKKWIGIMLIKLFKNTSFVL